VPLLVMAGGAIGTSRMLAIKEGHTQRACSYAAVVGPPGSAKTPALELIVEPAHAESERLREEWEKEMEVYANDLREYEKAMKANKKDGGEKLAKPKKPILRRLTVSDATAESLVSILNENPRGVVLVRDELIGWVKAMNCYREGGKGADQQFWLSAWSGVTVEVDRKKTHDQGPLIARKPFVGVIGGLVPEKLSTLRGDRRNERAAQDGFMDRILFSYPRELPITGETWQEVSPDARESWRRAYNAIRGIKAVPVVEGIGPVRRRPYYVRLTAEARVEWQRFTYDHAAEVNGDDFPVHLKEPWSKLRGYCGRLALIVHYLRWAGGEIAGDKADVDDESMRRAVALVDYFKSHARRVYSAIEADPRIKEAKRVIRWVWTRQFSESLNSLKGAQRNIVSRSDIHAGVWGGSRRVEELEGVLDLLCKLNYLRQKEDKEHPGRGRKPSPQFEVNPEILTPGNPFREFRDSENSEREPGEEG
jgi:hypothetical protein